jgi:uncharacterized repeat protein (TIGR01451 family)
MHHLVFNILRRSLLILGTVLLLAVGGRAATPTDMSIKVTGISFKVGGTGRYTITVSNRGNQVTDGPVHVLVTLPNGLTLAQQRGSDWTCTANGQAVDCATQRSFGAGRTSTFRLGVTVCDAAFPAIVTSFEVLYPADTKSGNNIAMRSTVIRPGHCGQVTAPPTTSPGIPTPTRTPGPPATASATAVPGNPAAPVVTSFTCNGAGQCTLASDESFLVQLSFTDSDKNAISWQIMGRRDDGFTWQAGHGSLGQGTASATIPLQYPGFPCSHHPCRQDEFTFTLTVTDTTGLTSAPVSIAITVLAG